MQATITNVGEKLRAGMIADVEVVLPTKQDVLVTPATSIVYAVDVDSVLVVDETKNEESGETAKKPCASSLSGSARHAGISSRWSTDSNRARPW